MPYIGNTIRAADDYRLIDDISSGFNGNDTTFALQVAGSAPVPFPKSPQQVLISVNGVIQEPDPTGASGFNLVGTNIVFSSAPTNGHAFFGIIYATADYLNAGGNFPSGSLGAPSITFIGDENTGYYRKGGGSVGFVSDATEIANFDSNGITISSGNLILGDSSGSSDDRIKLGASGDLQIYHNGSDSYIDQTGTGDFYIRTTNTNEDIIVQAGVGGDVRLRTNAGENALIATMNAGVELYFDDSKKFETSTTGIDITGKIKATSNIEINADGQEFRVGASEDFKISHSGSENINILRSDSPTVFRNEANNETLAKLTPNGSVELYYNNSKKLETLTGGVQVTGNTTIDGTGTQTTSVIVKNGTDTDGTRLGHSSNSDRGFIQVTENGADFGIQVGGANTSNMRLELFGDSTTASRICLGTEEMITAAPNGAVELYYDNSKKFETTSTGAIVSGTSLKTQSTGSVNVLVGSTNASGAAIILDGDSDGNGSGADYSYIEHDSNGDLNIVQDNPAAGGKIEFLTGGAGRVSMQSDKFRPANNNAMSLGTSGLRWSDLYLANDLFMADDGRIKLGASDDLQIYHDGSNSRIHESGTGILALSSNQIDFQSANQSESLLQAIENGAVKLRFDNSLKFETTSTGVDVTGKATFPDGNSNGIVIGNSGDYRLFHNGSNSYIENDTGNLVIDNGSAGDVYINAGDDIFIRPQGGEDGIKVVGNGAVELYHDNVKTVETSSSHLLVFGNTSGNHGGIKVRNTNTGNSSRAEIRLESENAASFATIFCDHQNTNLRLGYNTTGTTVAIDGNADMITGTIIPNADNSKNLGSASFRWANIYTTDLKLSNEGSQNDVDGTWGNYTIQEGHEDLFLINHRTGKKFKFNLTEVS